MVFLPPLVGSPPEDMGSLLRSLLCQSPVGPIIVQLCLSVSVFDIQTVLLQDDTHEHSTVVKSEFRSTP